MICRVSPEEQSGFIAKDNSGKANMYPVMVGSNKLVITVSSPHSKVAKDVGFTTSKGLSVQCLSVGDRSR